MPNRLALEKSPYLLQHADNPVDWHAWNDAAFEKAKSEDKPIFLSIGYSTCHWCHVMAHESFEDASAAKLMNEAFVCVKVDREERPDIDGVYMTVCQMITGSGGWPLTVLMTPDKKPFFAGTYFPKHGRGGQIGMMELVPKVADLWKTRRQDLLRSAEEIIGHLTKKKDAATGQLGATALDTAYDQLFGRYDAALGGFGGRPKFPSPHQLMFLLRYHRRHPGTRALEMTEKTLTAMRLGGIYDQAGFGFHRYSTDERWLVPHFEKMLYDQAMLVMAYTEAFLVTRNPLFRRTAEEIITYVLRDMTSPDGGFYSAEDADSEGEEGKFYFWTTAELEHILGREDGTFTAGLFNALPEGNFHDEATGHKEGGNILHLSRPLSAEEALRWEPLRQKLFGIREKRIHPYKDDKILADWNGLMIAALAKAARAFDEPRYAAAGKKALDFILQKLGAPGDGLLHRYRDGEAALQGNLDDYAFTVFGCLELYEATFDPLLLREAERLTEYQSTHFWDASAGAFFFSPDNGEVLIHRQKEGYDGAAPSGNSVSAYNLLRLGRLLGRAEFEEKCGQTLRAFSEVAAQYPSAHTFMMCALDFTLGPAHEVVIAEAEKGGAAQMIKALNGVFLPNAVILVKQAGSGGSELVSNVSYLKDYGPKDGRTAAYVCENFTCRQPTADVGEMLSNLGL